MFAQATGITVDPQFALALLVALFGAAGSFFAVKYGQAETQRLVKALHGRFDQLEKDFRAIEKEQVRQDERIKAQDEKIKMLRSTQRFKLASAGGPEQQLFSDEDE